MEEKIHFKITHGGVTRRFALSRREEDLISSLKVRVLPIIGTDDASLFWKDEDSLIVLDCDEDLKAAIDYAETKNKLACVSLVAEANGTYIQEGDQNTEVKLVSVDESQTAFNGIAFICDACDCFLAPSNGGRFKCIICDDYDLCAACLAKGKHDNHAFVHLRNAETEIPTTNEVGGSTRMLTKDVHRCTPIFVAKSDDRLNGTEKIIIDVIDTVGKHVMDTAEWMKKEAKEADIEEQKMVEEIIRHEEEEKKRIQKKKEDAMKSRNTEEIIVPNDFIATVEEVQQPAVAPTPEMLQSQPTADPATEQTQATETSEEVPPEQQRPQQPQPLRRQPEPLPVLRPQPLEQPQFQQLQTTQMQPQPIQRPQEIHRQQQPQQPLSLLEQAEPQSRQTIQHLMLQPQLEQRQLQQSQRPQTQDRSHQQQPQPQRQTQIHQRQQPTEYRSSTNGYGRNDGHQGNHRDADVYGRGRGYEGHHDRHSHRNYEDAARYHHHREDRRDYGNWDLRQSRYHREGRHGYDGQRYGGGRNEVSRRHDDRYQRRGGQEHQRDHDDGYYGRGRDRHEDNGRYGDRRDYDESRHYRGRDDHLNRSNDESREERRQNERESRRQQSQTDRTAAYERASQIPAHMAIGVIEELQIRNFEEMAQKLTEYKDHLTNNTYDHEEHAIIFPNTDDEEELIGNIAVDLRKHLSNIRSAIRDSSSLQECQNMLEERKRFLREALRENRADDEDHKSIAVRLRPILLTSQFTYHGPTRGNWDTLYVGFMEMDPLRDDASPPRVASIDPLNDGLFAPRPLNRNPYHRT